MSYWVVVPRPDNFIYRLPEHISNVLKTNVGSHGWLTLLSSSLPVLPPDMWIGRYQSHLRLFSLDEPDASNPIAPMAKPLAISSIERWRTFY